MPGDSAEIKNNKLQRKRRKQHIPDVPNIIEQKTTFGESVNNIPCVGPCYEAGTEIIHPLTLKIHQNQHYNFCPIQPQIDMKTGKLQEIDQCHYAEKKVGLFDSEFDIIEPMIKFNDADFLRIYYQIHSLEQAIIWIDSKSVNTLPYSTINRIMNCALNAYGKNNIISVPFADFVKRIALSYWVNDYAKKLNNPKLTKEILSRKITNEYITQIIKDYLKIYLNKWTSILVHFQNLRKYLYSRLKK